MEQKNIFPKFRDDLGERSKNVVFKNLAKIIEDEFPKVYEEVKYMVDRNIEKEALINKVSLLISIHTVDKEFERELLDTILAHFETFYNDKGESRF